MKIIVSDFDGTFFNDDYLENIDYLNKFVEAGNLFIIATGRGINNLRKDIEDYKIKYSYLICSDGSTIYDNKGNNLYTCYINEQTVYDICKILDNDLNISFTLLENDNIASSSLSSSICARYIDRKKALEQMNSIVQNFNDVYAYLSTNYINIRDIKTSKSEAINFLLKKYHFNKNDIYVIGDDVNDIQMIKDFNSFTYENSIEELKKNSKYIVKNFKEFIDKVSNF